MNNRDTIRIAIVGVGNCASSLIQGIHYYTRERCRQGVSGLMHTQIGGYLPCDIEVVAAFDIDARKVGTDVNRAIFAKPNCTKVFQGDIPDSGVTVHMGQVLDGISEHMLAYAEDRTFVRSGAPELSREQIVRELKRAGAEILVSYVPVGSEQAARFYAECALEAGVALINNMPVFIASDKEFAERFRARNLPIIGDDIKSQLGATITHRVLTDLFAKRGVKVLRTYQLNTGGNTDFLNMKNQDPPCLQEDIEDRRRYSLWRQKAHGEREHPHRTERLRAVAERQQDLLHPHGRPLVRRRSHGPGIDGCRCEDSPNSAGVVIDMIRCCKLALLNGVGGVLEGPSAYFCKHPPTQYTDDEAYEMTETFIA